MGVQKGPVIAVSIGDIVTYGCPRCGNLGGSVEIIVAGSAVWKCMNCGDTCCVFESGITKSGIRFSGMLPELRPHPRGKELVLGAGSEDNQNARFFAPLGINMGG